MPLDGVPAVKRSCEGVLAGANLRWVEEVRTTGLALGEVLLPSEQARVRARFWSALHPVLRHLAVIHSQRWRGIHPEDLDDLASTKALALLLRAERGHWPILHRKPEQIGLFASRVARHGVLDVLRRRKPRDNVSFPALLTGAAHGSVDADALAQWTGLASDQALLECVRSLPPRTRLAWLLRVLRGLSSRDISAVLAESPTVTSVDMLLSRARARMRAELEARGISPRNIDAGVFFELERAFGAEVDPVSGLAAETPPPPR